MDAIEEIKSRLNIEDVISEYVQLKRAGRNWKGISPFTSEKTPSFIVSPEKQIWHDFSSGKGGNMFSFVMEVEGVDFKGALELLARKAGVDLDQHRTSNSRQGTDKARLHQLLELTVKFYQVHFSKNKTALNYVLTTRRFSKETALRWQLGYAPSGENALVTFLKSKGYTETEMKLAGVSVQRYRLLGDMFRDRLMIPLHDSFGADIGFTGRLLREDPDAPKYINTPRTVLYDKSRHVFGLHFAKESIRRSRFVVVTEGNMDVIASHQAGVEQTVAVAGTALTEHHLKALSRLTNDVRLCFDADQAGIRATERAIPIASRVGVSLNIIVLPGAKDPDELIRQDPKLWQTAVTTPTYALDWLIEHHQREIDIQSAEGKRRFSDILLPIVSELRDSVEQDHYITTMAETLSVSREALTVKMTELSAHAAPVLRKSRHTVTPPTDKAQAEYVKAQDRLLALALNQSRLRRYLDVVTPHMLAKEEAAKLLQFLQTNPDFKSKPEEARQLKSIADYVKLLLLQYEELYQNLELKELEFETARLSARLVETYVKHQKQLIAARLGKADEARTASLLETARRLDVLLKNAKGRL